MVVTFKADPSLAEPAGVVYVLIRALSGALERLCSAMEGLPTWRANLAPRRRSPGLRSAVAERALYTPRSNNRAGLYLPF